jgi:hypothetical protein
MNKIFFCLLLVRSLCLFCLKGDENKTTVDTRRRFHCVLFEDRLAGEIELIDLMNGDVGCCGRGDVWI